MFSIVEISGAKVENQPTQAESASMNFEGISERQACQNGITIKGTVRSQEINETSEAELESKLEEQSNGQAGTPAK